MCKGTVQHCFIINFCPGIIFNLVNIYRLVVQTYLLKSMFIIKLDKGRIAVIICHHFI